MCESKKWRSCFNTNHINFILSSNQNFSFCIFVVCFHKLMLRNKIESFIISQIIWNKNWIRWRHCYSSKLKICSSDISNIKIIKKRFHLVLMKVSWQDLGLKYCGVILETEIIKIKLLSYQNKHVSKKPNFIKVQT